MKLAPVGCGPNFMSVTSRYLYDTTRTGSLEVW